jgi:methylated-DNA-[protein]-cysteine S-methyltransferase
MMKLEDIKTEKDVKQALKDCGEFAKAVYLVTYRIPHGKVCTYGRVAKLVGKPGGARAVANALHNNPLYPVVPCWRVVKEDGGFGGEPKAAAGRRAHVQSEGVRIKNGKVVMTGEVLF